MSDNFTPPTINRTAGTLTPPTIGLKSKKRPPAPALEAGQHFAGRYEIIRLLGRGGFGEVYRAKDLLLPPGSGDLALKIHRGIGDDPTRLKAIKDEFGLLVSLRHPNLAVVRDFGFADGDVAYFTQDLVSGAPISAGAINCMSAQGVDCLVQLCRALDYLHARGVLHRDIKPSNIMLSDTGKITLLDFGVAQAFFELENNQMMAGTPAYMAPEVIPGEPTDQRADLYSLGATIFEMLSGRRLFQILTGEALLRAHAALPPDPLPVSVPSSVATVVSRLLAKKPADRYATALEVAEAYAKALNITVSLQTDESLASYVLSGALIEAEDIQQKLARAIHNADGSGDVLLLMGESGTGKTRLIREAQAKAQIAGARWIDATLYGSSNTDLVTALVRQLRAVYPQHLLSNDDRIELARAVPELRKPRERLNIALDLDRARLARIRLTADWIAAACERTNGIVALDDAHVLTDGQLDDLSELMAFCRNSNAQVSFVVASRHKPGLIKKLSALSPDLSECTLLSARGSKALVENVLGTLSVIEKTEFAAAVLTGSERASAVWCQETLRLAFETGALRRSAGLWVCGGPIKVHSLSDLLNLRLQLLSKSLFETVIALAIVGRPTDLSELGAVRGRLSGSEDLASQLRILARKGMIDVNQSGSEPHYQLNERFSQIAVASSTNTQRQKLHLRAAKFLAAQSEARWPALLEAAEHFRLSDRSGLELECLARARTDADVAGRADLAAQISKQGYQRHVDLGLEPRTSLLLWHDSAVKAGAVSDAETSLAKVAVLVHDADWEAQKLVRLARAASRRGNPVEAASLAEQALALAKANESAGFDSTTILIDSHLTLAQVHVVQGSTAEAMNHFAAAADLAGKARDPSRQSDAELGRALAALRLGQAEAAAQAASRAATLTKRLNDQGRQSEALRNLGNALRERGLPAKARVVYKNAVHTARESGNTEAEAKALNNLGSTAHLIGRIEEALDAWQRSIFLKEKIGAISSALMSYASLGGVLTILGRHREASSILQKVIREGGESELAMSLAQSNLGDLMITRGHFAKAAKAYRTGLLQYRKQGWAQLQTHALVGLTRTLLLEAAPKSVAEARETLLELQDLALRLDVPEAHRRYEGTAAVLASYDGNFVEMLRLARSAANRGVINDAFADVFATTLENRWLMTLSLYRMNKVSDARKQAQRLQSALRKLALHIDDAHRARFLEGHPLHRSIVAGNLDQPNGFSWSIEDMRPSVQAIDRSSSVPIT